MRHGMRTQHVQQVQHVNHMDESVGDVDAEEEKNFRKAVIDGQYFFPSITAAFSYRYTFIFIFERKKKL